MKAVSNPSPEESFGKFSVSSMNRCYGKSKVLSFLYCMVCMVLLRLISKSEMPAGTILHNSLGRYGCHGCMSTRVYGPCAELSRINGGKAAKNLGGLVPGL